MIKIEMNGDGLSIKKDISLEQAGKIITFISMETSPAQTNYTASAELPVSVENISLNNGPSARLTISELWQNSNPKTKAQEIVVIGSWLSRQDQDGYFSSEEIKAQYNRLGRKLPSTFSRELNKARKSGWIELVVGENNRYFVTNIGEEAIDNCFLNKGKKTSSHTRAKTKKVSRKINIDLVDEAVKGLGTILPNMNGFPNYHDLGVKGYKIMWILAAAGNGDVDSLNATEIAYIAKKLKDNINIGDVNALTTNAVKKGWIIRNEEFKYELLHSGEIFLRSLVSDDGAN